MHEESLVRSLLSQVDAIAEARSATHTEIIEVELGPLSGVERLLLQAAFERLVSGTQYASTRLQINEVPLEVSCTSCRKSSRLDDLQFRCPQCGSGHIRFTRGDEFRLLNVTLTLSEHAQQHLTT